MLEAGRVGRPHGLDGSFHVTRPDPRLLALPELLVDGAPARVDRRAGTDARPILRLEGHAGRAAAEALRGAQLAVRVADAPSLGEGEYWAHELEGCAVVDGSRAVGRVRRMVALPSCEALAVERPHGAPELLVPLVRDAVRSVDVAARRIDVDLAFLGE
jgi:16S rRNA processing protein RimM